MEFNWQTKTNFEDCGVFAMRHMETYMGGGSLHWKCGFVVEGDQQGEQLMALRDSYLNVMIRSHLNAKKDLVLQRATAWWKIKEQSE
ncbi:unnamed protein product [Rhodiola kirilowii]